MLGADVLHLSRIISVSVAAASGKSGSTWQALCDPKSTQLDPAWTVCLSFYQRLTSCWCRYDTDIRSLALDSSLVSIAAQLLNSRKLRLYQDCVFLKHPGFSETHWHSDCPLSPLDTSAYVTAWIPLRPIKARFFPRYMKALSCTGQYSVQTHGCDQTHFQQPFLGHREKTAPGLLLCASSATGDVKGSSV